MTGQGEASGATQLMTLRPLCADDFEAVVRLDRRIMGRSRRGYFEKRLEAALRRPAGHIQLAADSGGELSGFVLARVVAGEFGGQDAAVVLEALGVGEAHQGRGIGRELLGGLEGVMRRKCVRELVSQAEWTNFSLLRFFAATGFALAPRQIVEHTIDPNATLRLRSPEPPEPPGGSHDPGLEHDAIPIRGLRAEDYAGIARIDRKVSGRDRADYLRRKLEEALQESAIVVSLAAEGDVGIEGFLTARVDFGGFGQTEPVAVLDTIGVDPAFARRGVGRSLVAQLFMNLSGLRVEKVETQVAREDFELLGFLYRCGFGPSRALAFSKDVA